MSRKVRPGSSSVRHTAVPMEDMRDWKAIFQEFQPDHNQEVKIGTMISILTRRKEGTELMPKVYVDRLLQAADKDQNGKISYEEFLAMLKDPNNGHMYRSLILNRAYEKAGNFILPKSQFEQFKKDDIREVNEFSCTRNPPLFMIGVSLIEIGVFIYHVIKLNNSGISVGANGPVPDSRLIFDPKRRFEVWRFLTYMLVHAGYTHVFFNVLMQLFLGVLLELVHSWWRILIVYIAGVIAGSLATSITDPKVYLAGASGGVYALIAAHLANVVMNWNEMDFPALRLTGFGVFVTVDVGVAVYYRYAGVDTNVGYVAHLAGAIAGLLVGIIVLRNLVFLKWEKYVAMVSIGLYSVLLIMAILFNIFAADLGYPDHYPPHDKKPLW